MTGWSGGEKRSEEPSNIVLIRRLAISSPLRHSSCTEFCDARKRPTGDTIGGDALRLRILGELRRDLDRPRLSCGNMIPVEGDTYPPLHGGEGGGEGGVRLRECIGRMTAGRMGGGGITRGGRAGDRITVPTGARRGGVSPRGLRRGDRLKDL